MCVRGSVFEVTVPPTVLETPRLVLRPFGDQDVSLVCAAFRANAVRLGRSGDETLTRTATWITSERAAWERGERYSFLVLAKDHDKPTLWGHASLSDVLRGPRQCASLGFWVDSAVEGRGIAGEALTRVIEFAFTEVALHRLEAAVVPENQRSRKLLERLRFQPEGRARGYMPIDGAWTDHLLYARLSTDC